MTPPSQRGERWTIVGGYDGARHALFVRPQYPERDDPRYCAPFSEIEVIPLSAVQALAEEFEERASMVPRENGQPTDQRRIDGETSAWADAARRLRDLTNPTKEDGPDE